METRIKRQFRLGGHKAYLLAKASQKVQIILVSTLPDYYAVGTFRLRAARAINEALRDAFDIAGRKSKVWVMPQGNITLPYLSS